MSRGIAIVVLLFVTPALGQMLPFVSTLAPADSFGTNSTDWVDIPSSIQTLDVPKGTAFMTWSLMARNGANSLSALSDSRVVIGDEIQPDHVRLFIWDNFARTHSGSWSTPVEAGEIPVKLQVRREDTAGGGFFSLQKSTLTWTLIVFPESFAAPAVGGYGVLAIVFIIAIGMSLKFRRPKVA